MTAPGNHQKPADAAGRFAHARLAFDNDDGLFREVAAIAATCFARDANRLRHLANHADYSELADMAHRINGTWSLYATVENARIPVELEVAARAGSADAIAIATLLSCAMENTALELKSFLAAD